MKFIDLFIEYLQNDTMKKCARFSLRYFLQKLLIKFGRERHNTLTKDMDYVYRQTCFEAIYIKDFIPQEKRRAQEAIIILEQKSTTIKSERYNDVQWKNN